MSQLRHLYIRSKFCRLPWILVPGLGGLAIPGLAQGIAKDVSTRYLDESQLLVQIRRSAGSAFWCESQDLDIVLTENKHLIGPMVREMAGLLPNKNRGLLLGQLSIHLTPESIGMDPQDLYILNFELTHKSPWGLAGKSLVCRECLGVTQVSSVLLTGTRITCPNCQIELKLSADERPDSPQGIDAEALKQEWLNGMRSAGATIFHTRINSQLEALEGIREKVYQLIEAYDNRGPVPLTSKTQNPKVNENKH